MWTKARILGFFWILALFFLQNLSAFLFPYHVPALLLIGVIYYGLFEGSLFGAIIGLYAGFLLDIYGVGKMGSSMAILAMVGASCGFSASKFFPGSVLTQIFLSLFGYGFAAFLNLVVYKSLIHENLDLDSLREAFSFIDMALVVLLAPFVFSFLRRVSFSRRIRRGPSWT